MKNKKEYNKLRLSCKELIAQIQNCLADDFKNYYKSDIKNWQEDLTNIKKKSKKIQTEIIKPTKKLH